MTLGLSLGYGHFGLYARIAEKIARKDEWISNRSVPIRSGSPLPGEDAEGFGPSESYFFSTPNYSSTVYNSVINGRESVRARNSEQDLSEITEIWEHIIGIFPPRPGITGFGLEISRILVFERNLKNRSNRKVMTHDFENFEPKISSFPLRICQKWRFSTKFQIVGGNDVILEIFGGNSSFWRYSTHFQIVSGNDIIFENNFEKFVKNDHDWDFNFQNISGNERL